MGDRHGKGGEVSIEEVGFAGVGVEGRGIGQVVQLCTLGGLWLLMCIERAEDVLESAEEVGERLG